MRRVLREGMGVGRGVRCWIEGDDEALEYEKNMLHGIASEGFYYDYVAWRFGCVSIEYPLHDCIAVHDL